MPIGWFVCPYEVVTDNTGTYRRCAVERFRGQVVTDGGKLSYGEILGDHGIAKVRAAVATLDTINAEPGFVRIPRRANLDEPLSDLSAAEKNAIKNKLLALGYTAAQLQAALGADMGSKTLGDLLRFAASRWRRPIGIVGGVTVFESVDWPRQPATVESVSVKVN